MKLERTKNKPEQILEDFGFTQTEILQFDISSHIIETNYGTKGLYLAVRAKLKIEIDYIYLWTTDSGLSIFEAFIP